jgi:hypothetical protein
MEKDTIRNGAKTYLMSIGHDQRQKQTKCVYHNMCGVSSNNNNSNNDNEYKKII